MPPFTNRFLPAFGRFFPGGGSAASSTGDPEVSKGMDEGFQAWMAQQREQANQANQYFELPSGAIPPELAAFGTPTNQGTHRFHKGAFPSIEKMAETMRQEREAKTSDTSFADYLEQSMLGGKQPITETKLGMPSPERAETEPAVPSTTERPASFSDLPPHIKALLGAMRSGKATPFQREIVKAELDKIRNPKREIQFPPKGATGYLQFNEENPEGKWVPLPESRGGLSVDELTAKGYTPKYDAQGKIEGWVPPAAPGAGVNPESYLPRGKTRQTATPEEWKQALRDYETGQKTISAAKAEGGVEGKYKAGEGIPPNDAKLGMLYNVQQGMSAREAMQQNPDLRKKPLGFWKDEGYFDYSSKDDRDSLNLEKRLNRAEFHLGEIKKTVVDAMRERPDLFPDDPSQVTQSRWTQIRRELQAAASPALAKMKLLERTHLAYLDPMLPPGTRKGILMLLHIEEGLPTNYSANWTKPALIASMNEMETMLRGSHETMGPGGPQRFIPGQMIPPHGPGSPTAGPVYQFDPTSGTFKRGQ